MKQMEEYKSMLHRLNALINALENGELSLDELVELEETTRKLHERSIILRYNAFKDLVIDEKPSQEEVKEVSEKSTPEPEIIPEPEPEKEEEQAFDFSIFENTADQETTEEVTSAPKQEIAETIKPEPAKQEDIAPEITPEPIKQPEPESTPEPVVESESEVIAKNEEEVAASLDSSDAKSVFLSKVKADTNSFSGHFAKLSTLIGAFGLNERLRFINDLFDGSSETFSDAIKALDSLNDINSARDKAADFAIKYNWDPEQEVVEEFMHYLSRRYA